MRELDEEVGVKAKIVAFNDHVESIAHDEGGVRSHYVIASFAGLWTAGEARTSEEADSVLWVDPLALPDLPVTPGLETILARAAWLIETRP